MKLMLLCMLFLFTFSHRSYAMQQEAPVTKEALQEAQPDILKQYESRRRSDSDKDRMILRYNEERTRIREEQK